jgi:Trypsin
MLEKHDHMKHLLPIFAFSLLIMAEDCEQPMPEPQGGTAYCYGNDYSVLDGIQYGYEKNGLSGAYDSIMQGTSSTDKRATVRVGFGKSYCSGVALNPRIVLTAAHCGYGEETTHRVYLKDDPLEYRSTKKIVHPDYLEYVKTGNYEFRKADLMLLYMDDPVPAPYVSTIYNSSLAKFCHGLVAQGWGKWEQPELDLRESKYIITQESEKLLTSRNAPEGKVCYGDSGGPLYADVAGVPQLAGITSTAIGTDCLVGANHVKLSFFQDWINLNMQMLIVTNQYVVAK